MGGLNMGASIGSLIILLLYFIPIVIILRFCIIGIKYMEKKLEFDIIRAEQMDNFMALYKKVNNIEETDSLNGKTD